MCYKAVIASVGGDEATLAKSLIISLEDVPQIGIPDSYQDAFIPDIN
jgi:hypothetical protein